VPQSELNAEKKRRKVAKTKATIKSKEAKAFKRFRAKEKVKKIGFP